MKLTSLKSGRTGFTLIELVTVITVIALLFSLVIGGFTFADRYAKRSKSEVTLKAVGSALELYVKDYGDYPRPQNPESTTEIAKAAYIVGGAACLYQALSGDGYDQIEGATNASTPESDGNLETAEAGNVKMKDMERAIWAKDSSTYFLIDGFGHPLQYVPAEPVSTTGGGAAPDPVTINNTYDLWSYGDDTENLTARAVDTLDSVTLRQAAGKWIKNW